MEILVCHTDGSHKPNGNLGSAFVLDFPDGTRVTGKHGYRKHGATANHAEALAILLALRSVPKGSHVAPYTDSMTCISGIKQIQTPGSRVPDRHWDVWLAIVAASEELGSLKAVWVKGHSGNPGNELADALADEAALSGPWLPVPSFRENAKSFPETLTFLG